MPHPRPKAGLGDPPADLPAPGDRLTLTVDSLAAEGDGVARHGALAVFIPQSAPGDCLEVEVTETAARFARARIISVLRPGPDRIAPPCPVYQDCGGCTWQHLSYPAQLQWKRTVVVEALRRLGQIPSPEPLVRDTLAADPPWRYRHKMAVPFAPPLDGGSWAPAHPAAPRPRPSGAPSPAPATRPPASGPFAPPGRAGPVPRGAPAATPAARPPGSVPFAPPGRGGSAPRGARSAPASAPGSRRPVSVPFAPPRRLGVPLQAGFYARRSHRIVPFETCAIQHPLLDRALAETLRLAAHLDVQAYDERTRRGDLRHLVGRVSRSTGELLLCLVTARPDFPEGRPLAEGLMAAIPECVGVMHNINGAPGNAILGRSTRTLAGRDHLIEELDGLRCLVSAPSFFQVSPAQAAHLYQIAARQADLRADDIAFDVYAGVGTLSLYLARAAGAVEAVEEVPEAVRDGRRNAAANDAHNVRFHLGAAEEVVPTLVARGIRPAVVVLDPPRKGAAEVVLEAIARARPRRVVYVSCNPATLARDTLRLAAAGYRVAEVQPVDMFPQTAHVECSALLERE